MRRPANTWRYCNIAVCIGAAAVMLVDTNALRAHDLSPGAPDWCGEQKFELGEDPKYDAEPGNWPGPQDTEGAQERIELGSTSLGTEFPGFAGRNLRGRFGELDPGGHFGFHCHDDRPTVILIISGTAVETVWENGEAVEKRYGKGALIAEGRGIRHWWKNPGPDPLTMVTVDLANVEHRPTPSPKDVGVWKEGAWFNMVDEFPHIGGLRGIETHAGILTLGPGQITRVTNHLGRPRFAYIRKGTVKEYRSDSVNPIVRETGEYSHASGATWTYWVNESEQKPVEIFIYRFSDCGGECRPSGDTQSD